MFRKGITTAPVKALFDMANFHAPKNRRVLALASKEFLLLNRRATSVMKKQIKPAMDPGRRYDKSIFISLGSFNYLLLHQLE
jgi:hypothetical protein